MKITIFGGGGFIGSAIADRLLKDGHELRIFERPRVESSYRRNIVAFHGRQSCHADADLHARFEVCDHKKII